MADDRQIKKMAFCGVGSLFSQIFTIFLQRAIDAQNRVGEKNYEL